MRALILSAGLGERLRPLTAARAKPAIEFLNMPMLAFPYYWLNTLGLKAVTFNTHYLPDSVRRAAMHVVEPYVQLHFNHEENILGSGGGIWNARFELQGDDHFAVANGDAVVAFAEPDIMHNMLRFHQEKDALATLLTCPLENGGTVWLDSYDELVNFGTAPVRPGLLQRHYASIMFVSKRLWKYLPAGPSNIFYDVMTAAIAQGERVYGYDVSRDRLHWFETGNVADYLKATAQCLEYLRSGQRFGQNLERMLQKHSPAFGLHSDWERMRLIADSTELDPSASLRGWCVLGENSSLGPQTTLVDSVVLPGAQFKGGNLSHQVVL
jgi:NDP-sugar pyrophosphorylase family protein